MTANSTPPNTTMLGEGAERALAVRNHFLRRNDYYTSDELIDLALSRGFELPDPLVRIRRGTQISPGAFIGDGTLIDGKDVVIGVGSRLDGAKITGNDVVVGENNFISGRFSIDRCRVADNNRILDLTGKNEGIIQIGSRNEISNVNVDVAPSGLITIGAENHLHDGLSLNVPFSGGRLFIGFQNSLGRDGGGVISTSYRFMRGWSGDIAIGRDVQTTRGAEVLGFSLFGWPEAVVENLLSLPISDLHSIFSQGDLSEISNVFDPIFRQETRAIELLQRNMCKGAISLFGVVKIKRTALTEDVTVKDDSKLHGVFASELRIPERCQVHNSSFMPAAGVPLQIRATDINIENALIRYQAELDQFGMERASTEYPDSDEMFYSRLGQG